MKKNNTIGLFDSGIGGFTVLKELKKLMPNENYIYLADLKNSPYGEKSGEEIFQLTKRNIDFLIEKGAEIVVFACNTASSYNVETIREMYNIPIVTVIESAVNALEKKHDSILVAATSATVKSNSYKKQINKKFNDMKVYSEACVKIAPLVEENNLTKEEIQDVVDSYIIKYRENYIDLLILGCTHYPIWREYFEKSIGENVEIIDPAIQIAKDVKSILIKNGFNFGDNLGNTDYYTTSKLEKFSKNVNNMLEETDVKKIKFVEL